MVGDVCAWQSSWPDELVCGAAKNGPDWGVCHVGRVDDCGHGTRWAGSSIGTLSLGLNERGTEARCMYCWFLLSSGLDMHDNAEYALSFGDASQPSDGPPKWPKSGTKKTYFCNYFKEIWTTSFFGKIPKFVTRIRVSRSNLASPPSIIGLSNITSIYYELPLSNMVENIFIFFFVDNTLKCSWYFSNLTANNT